MHTLAIVGNPMCSQYHTDMKYTLSRSSYIHASDLASHYHGHYGNTYGYLEMGMHVADRWGRRAALTPSSPNRRKRAIILSGPIAAPISPLDRHQRYTFSSFPAGNGIPA
jgi:hypothetical protein